MSQLKSIVHIDLNAFFAQCEVNINPSLKGKPVAVGGDHRRGIVSTCSYEARKYGVHSAMPSYQAKKLCPDLIFVGEHYSLYGEVSHRFMHYLKEKYPILEQVSIDECYLDLTDYIDDSNAYDYLRDLQIQIYSDLHLKCSIGYAHTKFLAKMASDYRKPLGLTLVTGDKYKEYFWPLEIEKMWGVGKQTSKKLREMGITTIEKLATSESIELKETLGIMYDTYINWANGKGNDVVDPNYYKRKSISEATTLYKDTDDEDELKEVIRKLCKSVSSSLQLENSVSKTVVLTLRDSKFNTRSKRKTMPEPTSDYEKIYLTAIAIFNEFYTGYLVRLVGVGLDNTKDEEEIKNSMQSTLFDSSFEEKNRKKSNRELIEELNDTKHKGMFKTLKDLEEEK